MPRKRKRSRADKPIVVLQATARKDSATKSFANYALVTICAPFVFCFAIGVFFIGWMMLETQLAKRATAFAPGATRAELITRLGEPIFETIIENEEQYEAQAAKNHECRYVMGNYPSKIAAFRVHYGVCRLFVRLDNGKVAAHFLSD